MSARSLIDLSGTVALVTGGSRGVGAATARLLARAGARVALTYRERADAAQQVVETIASECGDHRATAIRADLSTRDDNDAIVARTIAEFGRLDAFVASAGVWPADDIPVEEMSDEQWRSTLALNLSGVFFGCRAALRAMRGGKAGAGEGGRLVVVGSTAGQRGEAHHADYAATKGAVISFVKSLAVEAAPVATVNCVAPGWVDTEMAERPYKAAGGRGRVAIEATIPLGRVATPEDVAGPIVFLCSSLARHITGEVLNVNGGAVLCG